LKGNCLVPCSGDEERLNEDDNTCVPVCDDETEERIEIKFLLITTFECVEKCEEEKEIRITTEGKTFCTSGFYKISAISRDQSRFFQLNLSRRFLSSK
jgi:hypothetical protein